MPVRSGTIYEGEVGTVIDIDMRRDISTAINITLLVLKPGDVTATWVPTVAGARTLRYTTVAGDLVAGVTQIQPHLTLGAWTGYGRPVFIQVHRPL